MCKVSNKLGLYAGIAIKNVCRMIIRLHSRVFFAMSGSKQNIILHYFWKKVIGNKHTSDNT